MEAVTVNDNNACKNGTTVRFVDYPSENPLVISVDTDLNTMVALACAQRDRDPSQYHVKQHDTWIELRSKAVNAMASSRNIPQRQPPQLVVLTEARMVLINRSLEPLDYKANYEALSFGQVLVEACKAADITTYENYVLVDDATGHRYPPDWEVPSLYGDRTTVRILSVHGYAPDKLPPFLTDYETNAARIMKRSWESVVDAQSAKQRVTDGDDKEKQVASDAQAWLNDTQWASWKDGKDASDVVSFRRKTIVNRLNRLYAQLNTECAPQLGQGPRLSVENVTLGLVDDVIQLCTQSAQRGCTGMVICWPFSTNTLRASDAIGTPILWLMLLNYKQTLDGEAANALWVTMSTARRQCMEMFEIDSALRVDECDNPGDCAAAWKLHWGFQTNKTE